MKRLIASLLLCLLAGAAMAQTTIYGAPPPTAIPAPPAFAPPPPPTAVSTPGGHTDMIDGRATQALNLLEAQGFDNYTDFHAAGDFYVATVTSRGQTFPVTIDVVNGRITRGG